MSTHGFVSRSGSAQPTRSAEVKTSSVPLSVPVAGHAHTNNEPVVERTTNSNKSSSFIMNDENGKSHQNSLKNKAVVVSNASSSISNISTSTSTSTSNNNNNSTLSGVGKLKHGFSFNTNVNNNHKRTSFTNNQFIREALPHHTMAVSAPVPLPVQVQVPSSVPVRAHDRKTNFFSLPHGTKTQPPQQQQQKQQQQFLQPTLGTTTTTTTTIHPQFQFRNNSNHNNTINSVSQNNNDHGKMDSILSIASFLDRRTNSGPTATTTNTPYNNTNTNTIVSTSTTPTSNQTQTFHNTTNIVHHLAAQETNARKRLKIDEHSIRVGDNATAAINNDSNPNTSNTPNTEKTRTKVKSQGKKKVERDAQWMIQYNALKAYHEETGHANVPMHYASNKRLGHWINNQRQLYRKHKAGLPSSMTEKRIQLLEDLDFAWVLGKDWKMRRGKLLKKDESYGNGNEKLSGDQHEHVNIVDQQQQLQQQQQQQQHLNNVSSLKQADQGGSTTPKKEVASTLPDMQYPNIKFPFQSFYESQMPRSLALTLPKSNSSNSNGNNNNNNSPHTDGHKNIIQTFQSAIPKKEMSNNEEVHHIGGPINNNMNNNSVIINHSTATFKEASTPMKKHGGFGLNTSIFKDMLNYRRGLGSNNNEPQQQQQQYTLLPAPEMIKKQKNIHEDDSPHSSPPSILQTSSSSSYDYTIKSEESPKKGGAESIISKEDGGGSYTNTDEDVVVSQGHVLGRTPPSFEGNSVLPATRLQNMTNSDLQWQKHLLDLAKFKAKFGHCNVPFQYYENKSLGYWVHNQRQVYKKWLKGETCSLTQLRIDSLTRLGFSLKSQRALKKEKMAAIASKGTTSGDSSEEEKRIHPSDLSSPTKSHQVEQQPVERDILKNPFKSTTIVKKENEPVSIPKSITPVPKASTLSKVKIDAFDVLWARRLEELRDFYLSNGHSDVPSIYPANKPLGTWAMNQRQQYRKLQNGEKSSLSPSRICALEALKFRWYLGKGIRGKDSSSKRKKGKPASKKVAEIEINKKVVIQKKNTPDGVKSGTDQLSLLTDDVICIVLSFLPSIRCVVSYCLTSKRALRILDSSIHMERLYKSLYIHTFGTERIKLQDEAASSSFWRDAWHNVYSLYKGLKTQAILDEIVIDGQNENDHQKRKLGILSTAEEDEAIFYDNPSSAPPNSENYCLGYFGILKFNVKVPSCSGNNSIEKEQVAVWGDFNGLRIIDENPSDIKSNRSQVQYQTVGENRFGQTMAVVPPPLTASPIEHPCLYIGCAAGAVLAISAKYCSKSMSLKYDVSSVSLAHTNEVTALAWLPGSATNRFKDRLISGGCDGNVYLYPNALSVDHNFDLNTRVLCCPNENNVPILSLACCEIEFNFDCFQILITGDGNGNITLLRSQPLSIHSTDQRMKEIPNFSPLKVYKSTDYCRISNLRVVRDKYLISGDTSGNVRVWDIIKDTKMELDYKKSDKIDSEKLPQLSILFKIPAAHGGTIEKIDVIGDVLLTTGGSDGFIRGWDLKQGDMIGSVYCHKGMSPRQIQLSSSTNLKSAVVGLFFVGCESLISLCRDGSIHQWNYGVVSKREVDFQIRKSSWDLTTNEIEGGVIPAAAVLSNLAGKTTSALLIPHSNPPAEVLGLETLKRIMTCNGNSCPSKAQRKLRDCMRLSIIKAAYEHASNPDWRKFPETPFIGADGKVYRFIKKAFATFSGMRPCRKCRRASQGAYRCRLQLKHDSSDVDDPGHNSLNTLRSAINQTSFRPPAFDNQKSNLVLDNMSQKRISKSIKTSVSAEMSPDEKSNGSWDCHKCDKRNSEKNKRCPACSAWRGGKRKLINASSKKSKKQKQCCSFCQYPNNELGTKVCVMCHETIEVSKSMCQKEEKLESERNKPIPGVEGCECSKAAPKDSLKIEWQCHKCTWTNLAISKRCKSCLAWKGGKREHLTFTRNKTEEKGDSSNSS